MLMNPEILMMPNLLRKQKMSRMIPIEASKPMRIPDEVYADDDHETARIEETTRSHAVIFLRLMVWTHRRG